MVPNAFSLKPPPTGIPAARGELRVYWGGMNRTSKLALETSALLKGTVTPRQLERWSHAGFLPPGHLSAPELAQWVGKAHLAELSTTGPRSTDAVALAMARRYGCACPRLGEVLRRWLANPVAPPSYDPDSDEGTLAIAGEAEALQEAIEEPQTTTFPPQVIDLQKNLLADGYDAAERSPVIDSATGEADEPRTTVQTGLYQVRALMEDGFPPDEGAISSVERTCGLTAGEVTGTSEVLELLRPYAVLLKEEAYRAALRFDVEELARGMYFMGQFIEQAAPGRFTADFLDQIAGIMAPVGVFLAKVLATSQLAQTRQGLSTRRVGASSTVTPPGTSQAARPSRLPPAAAPSRPTRALTP
jgi:hypothetical protein